MFLVNLYEGIEPVGRWRRRSGRPALECGKMAIRRLR
jgi:hypothetical protein